MSSLLLLSLAAQSLASPVLKRAAPDFIFPGDAPFAVNKEDMAKTLYCPNGNPTPQSPPVLLVHGTGMTGEETWADGFVPALKADGYTACYLTIPNRSMGDMQVSAEYIAYNLHYLSQLSGGLKTSVMSHSQGGPDTQWALQFWPSTHNVTSSFVPLSPDFAGIDLAGTSLLKGICAGSLCQASMWQQSEGSHFYEALHRKNFRAQVPTTVVWTEFDGVVVPPEKNAQLPGATIIEVQDLCWLRPETHATIMFSSAGYALALDALQHGGVGNLARVQGDALNICFRAQSQNMNAISATKIQKLLENIVMGFLNVVAALKLEPVTIGYAE